MAPLKGTSEGAGFDQSDTQSNTSAPRDNEGTPVPAQTVAKPYSVFDKQQRYVLTAVLGLASLASPLTANIYLPLLPLLQTQYSSSAQAINLTLTLYVVIQAVMPAFFAPAADAYGRRLVSLVTYTIYTLGSLGLVINDVGNRSYVGLLLLRAVEALGASACASITYGVVSDVCIPAERGTMVGPAISAANVGTVLGPVLGGLIAWRSGSAAWVFAALTVFGAANTLMIALCLPETARGVVGNGAEGKRLSQAGIWGWMLLGPRWGTKKKSSEGAVVESEKRPGAKRRLAALNPLSCLSIMLSKDTALIVFLASCTYAVWYTVLASIPQVYSELYGWSELLVGLAFLPSAVTVILAGFVNGPWMNWRFRRTAHEAGLAVDSHRVDGFPIERARARGLWPMLIGTYVGIAGLGWAIQAHAPVAVLLVVQAATGFIQVFLFFAFNTLLVDTNPDRPSTASAAASLVRSGLSGLGVAIVNPLVGVMGWGGYFTLMAGVVGILQGLGMIVLQLHGQKWRERRMERERERECGQTASS